ncbi:MAG: hypothetical protein ACOY16_08325 [Chloroflexota bacterium]
MKISEFFRLYWSVFVSPTKAFQQIDLDNRKMLLGFLAVMIPAIGYTLFYIMASSAGGAPSVFVPWLNLPMERYFYYAIFLAIPAYLLAFLFASGFVYFCMRLARLQVSYDSIAMVLGLGIGVASWSSMLHDLTDAFLGFVGLIDIRQYEQLLNEPTFWRYLLLSLYTIYFIWFFVLFQKGIAVVSKIDKAKASIFAFIGLAAFQSVLLLFIR